MDVAMPGKPRICYANVTAEKATRIIEANLLNGDSLPRLAKGHFGHGMMA